MRKTLLALALSSALLAACRVVMNEEHGADAGLSARVVSDCVVQAPSDVEGPLPAPVALELPEGSLWIFRSVSWLQSGAFPPYRSTANASALVQSAGRACGAPIPLRRDASNAPASLLALTAEEVAANASRTDGRALTLAPRGGFAHGGRAFLYYDQVLVGPGTFDAERIGTGICTIDAPASPDATCVRAPNLLWSGAKRSFGGSGVVADDGNAYLLSCEGVAAFENFCAVARVAPERVTDVSEYRYYNAFSGFGIDARNFTVVLRGAGIGAATLSRAPAGGFQVVVADIFDASFTVARAPTPEGDYGPAQHLFDAIKPDSFFIGLGGEHASLRSADGRTLAFTYSTYTPSNESTSGLHLVTVEVPR